MPYNSPFKNVQIIGIYFPQKVMQPSPLFNFRILSLPQKEPPNPITVTPQEYLYLIDLQVT